MFDSDSKRQEILDSLPDTTRYFTKRLVQRPLPIHSRIKEDVRFHFDEILEKFLNRHLANYKPPDDADNNFDCVLDFREKFMRNCERYVYYELQRVMREIRAKPVVVDVDQKKLEEIPAEGEDMETTVEKHILQQKLENANAEFLRYCNTLEKKVVEAMKEGYTWNQLITHVGMTQSGKLLSLQQARHIRNVLEYRMICWYSIRKIFDADFILKGLNRHPNLNKRFFREEKLSKLPDFPTMQAVAKGNTKRPEKYEHKTPKHSFEEVKQRAEELFKEIHLNRDDEKWSFCSKFDERGQKHDHYVTYINDSGFAYSHISRESWSIFDDEQIA